MLFELFNFRWIELPRINLPNPQTTIQKRIRLRTKSESMAPNVNIATIRTNTKIKNSDHGTLSKTIASINTKPKKSLKYSIATTKMTSHC